MTPLESRTFDAASRLLAVSAADPDRYNEFDATTAAWLVGRGGGGVPTFPDRIAQLLAEMAVAFGAGRNDEALQRLEEVTPIELQTGSRRLWAGALASLLAGRVIPERLVELLRAGKTYIAGELVAGTTRPEELLAFYGDRGDDAAYEAIGELVIRHRDAGVPLEAAEAKWRAILVGWPTGRHNYRGASLIALVIRLAVRDSIDAGIVALTTGEASYMWPKVWQGVLAVLARLVRVDPARAVRLVLGTDDPKFPPNEPSEMIRWISALAWDFALPPEAMQVVEACLGHVEPDEHVELARELVSTRDLALVDRAIAAAGEQPPPAWARALGDPTKRLREAGYFDDAELVRERVVRLAPSELDFFDMRSAVELPNLNPWQHGTNLP
ncbi:MAG TPA: hypothetical protein VGM88_27115 [Kofleriaceae bacterium]|jgi:hypothetical protein